MQKLTKEEFERLEDYLLSYIRHEERLVENSGSISRQYYVEQYCRIGSEENDISLLLAKINPEKQGD